MPLPYSVDLRERVLLAHEHGEGNAAALAARFGVAVNTVKNWVRAAATEGRRVAKPRGRGPAPRQLVAADNDATLAELARGWRRRPGSALADRCSVSPSSGWACRAKNPSGERADARRCRRRARLLCRTGQEHRPEDLVFVDESGVSIKLTWLSARAPRGQRAYGSAPGH